MRFDLFCEHRNGMDHIANTAAQRRNTRTKKRVDRNHKRHYPCCQTTKYSYSLHCNLQPLTVNGVDSRECTIYCVPVHRWPYLFISLHWLKNYPVSKPHTHSTTNPWAFRYDSRRFSTSWSRLNRLSGFGGRHFSPAAHRFRKITLPSLGVHASW